MSKVISFRLDPNNQRESYALAVLQERLSQGFSTRHTLTEALLNLDSDKSQAANNGAMNDLSQQIKELLENIQMGSSGVIPCGKVSSQEKLSDGFVSSILKTAKPGLRPEE